MRRSMSPSIGPRSGPTRHTRWEDSLTHTDTGLQTAHRLVHMGSLIRREEGQPHGARGIGARIALAPL